jgi:hypothetical protein
MIKNHKEAVSGTNAFQAFVKEFGPDDIYNRIILEILLEELVSKKEFNNLIPKSQLKEK